MGSLEHKMFKKILLCLFVALVTCQSGESDESSESMESMEMEDSETRSGLCMEDEEVMYWCTAGTPLGEKLSAAMMTCSGARRQRAGRRGTERNARRGRSARGREKEKARSASLLRRSRLGSWRNSQVNFVSSPSSAGWTRPGTTTTSPPRPT